MNKEILKKAILRGILFGLCTYLIYALVFSMLIDHKPAKDAFFGTFSLIFLAVITVAEIFTYYFTLSRKAREENKANQ